MDIIEIFLESFKKNLAREFKVNSSRSTAAPKLKFFTGIFHEFC